MGAQIDRHTMVLRLDNGRPSPAVQASSLRYIPRPSNPACRSAPTEGLVGLVLNPKPLTAAAPTEGFEQWVGSRTTHRLITQEYARLVLNMLGTEVVLNQTKSVVTASTWWAGGYPCAEP